MPSIATRHGVVACVALGSGLWFWACVSAPVIIPIPPAADAVAPAGNATGDYRETLAAIVAVMARDLKLPAVAGSVTFYPSRQSYREGVAAEWERELAVPRNHSGSAEDRRAKGEVLLSARYSAANSVAVAMGRRVLVNQKQLRRFPWWERVQILAHELTHTVEKSWTGDRRVAWHRWLSEGFAEWSGYRVVEKLGGPTFVENHRRISTEVAEGRRRETYPELAQLASAEHWLHWLRAKKRPATYGQAFLAVELLIERKGVSPIADYFRLFEKSRDREQNFMIAFGQPVSGFERMLGMQLRAPNGR